MKKAIQKRFQLCLFTVYSLPSICTLYYVRIVHATMNFVSFIFIFSVNWQHKKRTSFWFLILYVWLLVAGFSFNDFQRSISFVIPSLFDMVQSDLDINGILALIISRQDLVKPFQFMDLNLFPFKIKNKFHFNGIYKKAFDS